MKTMIIIASAILTVAFVSYYPSVLAQEGSNYTSFGSYINNEFYNYGLYVWSETPNTLILTAEESENSPLAHVIEVAKQNGYQIDAITEDIYPSAANQSKLIPYYTIFFSRQP